MKTELKREVRRPTQADYDRMHRGLAERVRKLARAWPDMSPAAWEEAFFALLEEGHMSAGVLGRRLAGDHARIDADDIRFGKLAAATQEEFLAGFVQAIEDLDPRYWDEETGTWRVDQIERRGLMYVQRMRGTANETFVLASHEKATFAWHMLTEEHCEDCPRYAAGGPYKAGELRTYPGSGATQCKTNCGCVLVRYPDKVISFAQAFP